MMTNTFKKQGYIQPMMETLKRQMEAVYGTQNAYAYNAQLMAVAAQSLTVELSLLNLLKAWRNKEEDYPWHSIDIGYWIKYLNDFDKADYWDNYWLETFPHQPSEFDMFSTFMVHQTHKEMEDGRDFYKLKKDGLWNNNANMLDRILGDLSYMDTDYSFELAYDAIDQLRITFEEIEKILKENNYQKADQLIDRRPKTGERPHGRDLLPAPVVPTHRRGGQAPLPCAVGYRHLSGIRADRRGRTAQQARRQ